KILLLEPYPNPFNDALIVSYFVPYAGYLRLSVVDILGREVGILKEGNSEIGYNRLIWFPSNLSSGNYFIVLKLKGETVVKKVMYLK
ncbi:MAG: T9SS type A sorting domain-containing protein, partial [Candidatus Marinimicrobia bacterium]|nr:T9SS type A sorting domain-containing protein [Candidatus Neomarinimicrobiota bacterium]